MEAEVEGAESAGEEEKEGSEETDSDAEMTLEEEEALRAAKKAKKLLPPKKTNAQLKAEAKVAERTTAEQLEVNMDYVKMRAKK